MVGGPKKETPFSHMFDILTGISLRVSQGFGEKKKGTLAKYRRGQGNMSLFLGNRGTNFTN